MNETQEKTTIMVVDDTPTNLNVLREMFVSRDYRVLMFPSGSMVLKALKKKVPDLILLDVMMPEMDGFETCRLIKENEALRDIPVIFISARDDEESKVRAFSMGGVDYVTKPFQYEEVNARVETHLQMFRMRRELKHYNQCLENLVKEKVREISDSQLSTIAAVSVLAESRDDDTGHHIERTRTFCRVLATKLRENPRYAPGISDAFVETIFQASPLHDIGKVGIADAILLKPDKLTREEFEIMKTHTLIGARTLQTVRRKYPGNSFVNMGIAITRSHHEKWDGSGYPDGLAGDDIPLSARIMALCDVYDALRSRRVYKQPYSHSRSSELIREGSGSHFDPAIVQAFLQVEAEFARIRDGMSDGLE